MAALKVTASRRTSLGSRHSALGLSRAAKAGTAKRACLSRAYAAMHASAKAFGGTASPVRTQKSYYAEKHCENAWFQRYFVQACTAVHASADAPSDICDNAHIRH